jgi:hypothetical protein
MTTCSRKARGFGFGSSMGFAAAPKAGYRKHVFTSPKTKPRGIAGSAIDLLIYATALRRSWQIFTTDRDLCRYAALLSLKLYNVR